MADDPPKKTPPKKVRVKPQPRSIKSNGIPAADLNKIVARNVYDIRRSLNLSREKMAERTGIGLASLGALERGSKNLTLASLAQIAVAYGVDTYALIGSPDHGVSEAGGLSLDMLSHLTSSIDNRVHDLLATHGPVSLTGSHLASIVAAVFDVLGNTADLASKTDTALAKRNKALHVNRVSYHERNG